MAEADNLMRMKVAGKQASRPPAGHAAAAHYSGTPVASVQQHNAQLEKLRQLQYQSQKQLKQANMQAVS